MNVTSGAVAQLVDNAPASATPLAELQSHNTGKMYADAPPLVTLIAGPIGTPPLLFAPSVDDVIVTPSQPPLVVPPPADGGGTIVEPPVVVLPPVIVDDGILSQAELDSLVGAAIARWEATGLSAAQVDAAAAASPSACGTCPRWYLGEASAGHVMLDSNAAGNSWFIDATPDDDSEFAGSTQLGATATGGAAGRIDALTTVLHELGHQLGLDDSYVSSRQRQPDVRLHPPERAASADRAPGGWRHAAPHGGRVSTSPPSRSRSATCPSARTCRCNSRHRSKTRSRSPPSATRGPAPRRKPATVSSNTVVTAVDQPNVTISRHLVGHGGWSPQPRLYFQPRDRADVRCAGQFHGERHGRIHG